MKLTPSSGGAFEVIVNDEKVYSKLDTGVFPDNEELIEQLKEIDESMR